MKFGIVGTGMIAHFHAQAIEAMEGSVLHSCYNRDPEKAADFSERYGIKNHTSLEEFLADPELEIITIGTPSGSHLEPALAAMEAGKHVICEKPLEVNLDKINSMIEASEKNNVTLAAILNRRFNESVVVLKDAVDKGRFGTLTLVEASIKWYRDQAYYDSAGWRGTWALDGGGALMNQSIHIIDQLIHTVGLVKRVTASMGLLTHENIEVEDTAVALLEFENGAKGIVQGSTSCWSSTGHPAEVNICGSEGSAFLADEHFKVWDFKNPAPEDAYVHANLMATEGAQGLGANDPNAINFTGHQRNFEEVVNSIKEGRKPSVDCLEARKAVAVITAIYESAKNDGKWVTVN